MQTDFLAAIRQIAAERGIDPEEILDGVKQAIRSIFKNDYPDTEEGATLEVEIDPEAGNISVYADKKVVKEVTNPPTQISVEDAKKLENKLKEGDHILVEITHTGDFGRVAAQAARQVILQKLKESEKEAVIKEFKDKIGTIEMAIIQRTDNEGNVLVEIRRAIAKMPPNEQVSSERYRSGDRLKVFLKKIHEDAKGKTLIVSRADPSFLRVLFEIEVPEIASGTVEIMGIAREEGSRSKVSVRSNSSGVDPIGSCIGQRGSRINAITNELRSGPFEEKIDVISWDEDISKYIANAIKPAEALQVKVVNANERHALILVDDEKLSLAIGKEGQNARLAAKLTGWKLDIQGEKMYEEGGKISKFEKDAKSGSESSSKVEDTESELVQLGLGKRVVSALEKLGINTKDQLEEVINSGQELKGIGEKSLDEIKAALK